MNSLLRMGLVSGLIFLSGVIAGANPAPSVPMRTLVVAVEPVTPFIMRKGADDWSGITIDLWKKVAANLNLSYRFVEVPAGSSITRLSIGEADVALRPYPLSEENEELADFSDVYYHTGLGLEVYRRARSPWKIIREDLLTLPILSIIGVMAVTLAGAGFLVWRFERSRNRDQFGGEGLHGFGSGMWWASATMTTVGYGDKIPRTFWGRSIAVVLMFASLIITSVFTAAVTSLATVQSFQQPQVDPRDLSQLRLAVVGGSVAEEFLAHSHLQAIPCADAAEAEKRLRQGHVDAYVESEPELKFARRHDPQPGFTILPRLIAPVDLAFAFPEGSPLRETVDRALLHVLQDPAWTDIQYAYVGP